MNIEVRQGIKYLEKNGTISTKYGLVIETGDDYIRILPVDCLYDENGIRVVYCYDEPEGQSLEYQHNVRLKDAPEPFTELNCVVDATGITKSHNVYVKADWNLSSIIHESDFIQKRVRIIDNGVPISDRDWHDVCSHMGIDQLQKEKSHDVRRRGIAELESRLGLNRDDMELPQDDVEFE